MKRNKSKSPYEVFGKDQLQLHDHQETQILEPITSDRPESHRSIDQDTDNKDTNKEVSPKWPRQPKMLIWAQSRIQISVSYQLAIAIILGIILIILASFRIGQNFSRPVPASDNIVDIQSVSSSTGQDFSSTAVSPIRPTGGQNRIVIQTHKLRSELEPVQHYFAKANIACHLRQINNRYYLVTDQKYNNPSKKGNDGYIARQKIIEIGRKYSPPAGFKSFGPKAFEDVYGMKFQD